MNISIFLIPVFTLVGGLLLYKHNGKKEIIRFDVVQFIYAFVLSPLLFIWLKSMLFVFLRTHLEISLSLTQLFMIDTVFSVVFMFVFAFMVIHSLTKSFENQRYKDPLFDLFKHSEFLHLWISHLGVYFGGTLLIMLISLVNVLLPIQAQLTNATLYLTFGLGITLGIIFFVIVWLANFHKNRYMLIMKLLFAAGFVFHVILYFVFDPGLSTQFLVYWLNATITSTLVFLAFFLERSNQAIHWIESLSHKKGWSAQGKKFLLSK